MPVLVSGNAFKLLQNGKEFFPALEARIDAAQREIFLETYIFFADVAGLRIAAALQRAARRGVAVHLTVDGFGSKDLPRELVQELEAAGVQVLVYRPEIARFQMRRHRLRRLHRKVSLIDDKVAFIGGINIIDDENTPGHTPPRYDYAVQIQGPILRDVQTTVRSVWEMLTWTHFKQRWRYTPLLPIKQQPAGNQAGAIVIRDNLRHRDDIEDAYLAAIDQARREIVIATAYFLPGLRFRRALMEAAARGVRVILLLQGRVEYVLLHYASRALYGSLLEAGVEIVEYHKSFMHAKVAVIDGEWSTVGSSNIDPFSLMLSREANVVILDTRFSGELRQSLELAMREGARPVGKQHWKQRPLAERVLTWMSYGLGRFLMGMLGYAQK
jgi:cardiolipin synthase A/B